MYLVSIIGISKKDWRFRLKMIVRIEKDIYIPSGLYCGQCTRKFKTQYKNYNYYCLEFGPFLEEANNKCLKCEECLLNLRKSLVKQT